MRRLPLGHTGEIAVESNERIALLLPNVAASPGVVIRPLVIVPNDSDQPRGPSEDEVSDAGKSSEGGRLPALRCGGWFGSSGGRPLATACPSCFRIAGHSFANISAPTSDSGNSQGMLSSFGYSSFGRDHRIRTQIFGVSKALTTTLTHTWDHGESLENSCFTPKA